MSDNSSPSLTIQASTLNIAGVHQLYNMDRRFGEIGDVVVNQLTQDSSDFSFFALQEAFHQKKVDRLIYQPALRHGLLVRTANQKSESPSLVPKMMGSGLALITNHEIIESEFEPFEKKLISEAPANKGVLFTRLRNEKGQELDVYTTHLQSYWIGSKKVRQKQLEQIWKFIDKHSGSDRPVVLMGDFNTAERLPEYDQMVERANQEGFSDITRLTRAPGEKRKKTYKWALKLDYILMRPGDQWKWVSEQSSSQTHDLKVSDHLLLSGRILLEGEIN